MNILHTSDWHLGRTLFGRKRYHEFEQFLDWLTDTIRINEVDVLLVSGDIFDTSTPANRAQQLYYNFLFRVSASTCKHVMIIGGNHDSPSFLDAPKELLKELNVIVIGSITEKPDDEVVVLHDNNHLPMAVICAVPYLRDKDIRMFEPGETIDDKNAKLVEGVENHYRCVCNIAKRRQMEINQKFQLQVPIIAMGHFFTTGGKTVEGDGVRELYVGSLVHVDQDMFSSSIDYFALGHLHVSQRVGKTEHIRYCGSPIPMGFGEAHQQKKVLLARFKGVTPTVQEIIVPCFQQLLSISGTLEEIVSRLEDLVTKKSSAWLEIEYTGNDIIGNLREIIEDSLQGSAMEIGRIKNRSTMDRMLNNIKEGETLDDLDAEDVFKRCLDVFEVSADDREGLKNSYNEIIKSLHEEDVKAE